MPDFNNGCEPENGTSKSGWTPHDHYMAIHSFPGHSLGTFIEET